MENLCKLDKCIYSTNSYCGLCYYRGFDEEQYQKDLKGAIQDRTKESEDNMTTREKIDNFKTNREVSIVEREKNSANIIELSNDIWWHDKEITKLEKQLKAEQEVYDPNWRPKKGERYFYISCLGDVCCDINRQVVSRLYVWNSTRNNIYKTEAQCKKGKQAVELMAQIKETFNLWDMIDDCIQGELEMMFGDRIQQLKDYL